MKGSNIVFKNFVETISSILQRQPKIHSLSDSDGFHMTDECKAKSVNVRGMKGMILKRSINRTVIAHLNVTKKQV